VNRSSPGMPVLLVLPPLVVVATLLGATLGYMLVFWVRFGRG